MKRALLIGLILSIYAGTLSAQPGQTPLPLPSVNIGVGQANSPSDLYITLQILFLITILSLAPAILIMVTSFTRIVIVFHFLRQALGTQQVPPNQILIALALFLTFFIMRPTFDEINKTALQPYLNGQIKQETAFQNALKPIRTFMFKHTREKDLALFLKISANDKPQNREDISTLTLIPAFVLSELRLAFQIGFLLYVPFLIIDVIIASILMSMGMFMLPPMMISLPFKILLFVMVDGWYLLISSVINGF
ncbi:MAG: flagellar type III secretion system pore protein FliP [Calditrichia bacterium]